MIVNGIPPISDYAHWNEDAERIWYEENKYDMLHPEVFEDYDDHSAYYDDEIPENECMRLYGHFENQDGGSTILFGPNGDTTVDTYEYCSDCGMALYFLWTPKGYKVTSDWMVIGDDLVEFPVFERIAS